MNDVDLLITAPLPPFLAQPLAAGYRCHDYVGARDPDALLREVAGKVRGLVQGGGTVTPTSLLDALPALEIISVFGVGYDGVPTGYCRERGIKVTNTPDVLTDDVADVAVALILMTARNFVGADRFVRAGDWPKRSLPLTTKLAGRSVGIVGLGRIGKAIATRVEAMGMRVAYTGRKPQDVPYHYVDDLAALAGEVDFLVIACPGGPATKHLIDQGHRDLAFVTVAGMTMSRHDKIAGFHAAAEAAGLGASARVLDGGPLDEYGDSVIAEVGRATGLQLAADPGRPTGLVALNDLMALGLMAGLREGGVRVPEQVSVEIGRAHV